MKAGDALEEINYFIEDTAGNTQDTLYYLEIRHFYGESCANWTLSIKGGCPNGW